VQPELQRRPRQPRPLALLPAGRLHVPTGGLCTLKGQPWSPKLCLSAAGSVAATLQGHSYTSSRGLRRLVHSSQALVWQQASAPGVQWR
jgi:hypothetical protein